MFESLCNVNGGLCNRSWDGKCTSCGRSYLNDESIPVVPSTPSFTQSGWQCPRCSGVNAPFVSRCPCVPIKYEVTC